MMRKAHEKKKKYTASKLQPQGRTAWNIAFRHPVKMGKDGAGLKVQRGLGTSDAAEADQLVNEMNILLSDDSYWNLNEKKRAEQKFHSVIVDAFFDFLSGEPPFDPWEKRDEIIPLPSVEDGFSKIMFLGTTGAGKTSLLRHLIGSDPKKDRFPSTSTGKTTIADMEVIVDDGTYQAVVVFSPKENVDTHIEESINQACRSVWEKQADKKIAKELLNHAEQRFRLSYLLGTWSEKESVESEDDGGFESKENEETPAEVEEDDAYPSQAERQQMLEMLYEYIEEIKEIAEAVIEGLSKEWDVDVRSLTGEDLELVLSEFEEIIAQDTRYRQLVEKICTQVLERFNYLKVGQFEKRRNWPERWTFQCQDRGEFIRHVRWFSSNHAKAFGRLLTPLVQGIRVRGPFYHDALGKTRGLVLMDGEGLGHVAGTVADVPTHYTSRYHEADVILLIDNAQQPMQAGALSVIYSVTSSGYQDKLFLAFTHFDQVQGDNIPTTEDRQDHLLDSVKNALGSLKDSVGESAINRLEKRLEQRCFMLGGLHEGGLISEDDSESEMERLMEACLTATEHSQSLSAHPIYVRDKLQDELRGAIESFHRSWNGLLGFSMGSGIQKEHWTRIKALTRRIGTMGEEEYQSLRPLAELLGLFIGKISLFLDKPKGWKPAPPMEPDEKEKILNAVRREVHHSLSKPLKQRLIVNHRQSWLNAFERRGRGSTSDRREDIQKIYKTAAPTNLYVDGQKGLLEFLEVVSAAIKKAGGKVE